MKLEVLKEMPFMRVGAIFHTVNNGSIEFDVNISGKSDGKDFLKVLLCAAEVDILIRDKWMGEINKESLEDKLRKRRKGMNNGTYKSIYPFRQYAEISKKHYLEAIDRAKEKLCKCVRCKQVIEQVRTLIEIEKGA